ncbi:unnamed protein product [Rotaria sordida]|uniref:Uncharacterized protein n=1 Tax=Rotaria sordida TaxID=392033 RepID=A0A818KVL9_9BILA|nr:unnamed protein product [Rotaria sordida]CAF1165842.1 unnamed protein product [Rotaria sordida]CAF3558688.1 unnamed protein product [Rotaria sordida]CAF3746143.1 unnamed protein product [Rotaria sordida]
MYKDAGYGDNWQPTPDNIARRIDPYGRSCAILGCFFVIGFILIVIVVLSLIPVYISRSSSPTKNTVQVPKVYINGYTLRFRSPSNSFNIETILSQSNNREALRAALTAMIQSDSILSGSIIDITKSSLSSKRKRRYSSDLLDITFDLYITSGKTCTSVSCLNQFQTRSINQLCNKNRTTAIVRYEQPNTDDSIHQSSSSSNIYWLNFQLPNMMKSNVSFVNVDLKIISSSLETLINLDKNLNYPSITDIITSIPDIITSVPDTITSTTTTTIASASNLID